MKKRTLIIGAILLMGSISSSQIQNCYAIDSSISEQNSQVMISDDQNVTVCYSLGTLVCPFSTIKVKYIN